MAALDVERHRSESLLLNVLPRRIAERLKTLRGRRGLTQEVLAAKAGLSRTYLARLETARQDPTLATLLKLAKALGVVPPNLAHDTLLGAYLLVTLIDIVVG